MSLLTRWRTANQQASLPPSRVVWRTLLMCLVTCAVVSVPLQGECKVYTADPSASPGQPGYYNDLVSQLQPGDTLELPAGTYRDRLNVSGLRGTPENWITITGPEAGAAAVITTDSGCCNTVQLGGNWYVAIKNLTVDSAGMDGIDGINSKGDITHDILIENCTIVGVDSHQLTVGISSFSPAWNWVIRGNTIIRAGTGLYLGSSTGGEPFIAGTIERNLVVDTIGYNMQIKHQNPYGDMTWTSQLPPGPHKTIIRDNVFLKRKSDWPDELKTGPRPNLLVGTFPDSGTGSNDLYEIYGNFFYKNNTESLLQATGRVAIHDNVFVNDNPNETAIYVTDHNGPIRVAYIYNNTIYSTYRGIRFANQPRDEYRVIGNLIFSDQPLGNIANAENNVVDTFQKAADYVNNPSMTLGQMDFYPRSDCAACQGTPLDLSVFSHQTDYDRDFNGMHKGDYSYRGAYAGSGSNPGWQLNDQPKSKTGHGHDTVAPAPPTEVAVQ